MEVVTQIHQVRRIRSQFSHGIGCVLTMGAIHEGHLSLIRRSVQENSQTICSIFVNPLQFPDKNDLALYPGTLEKDLGEMQKAGVDVVFVPASEEMYDEDPVTKMSFPGIADVYEGRDRPGHFEGVGIAVTKLLNIIRPHIAYFGEKDFQQLALIKALVKDLNFDTQIRSCETIRESNGLAISSRNSMLNEDGKRTAGSLSKMLYMACDSRGRGQALRDIESNAIYELSNIRGIDAVHYFEFVSRDTLRPVDNNKEPCVLLAAVTVQGVRLIDNLIID